MTAVPLELDRRFRDAAADEGLLDAAYDVVDSPVGPLLIAESELGVCRISFDPEPERELDGLAAGVGTRVLRSPRRLDAARRELHEYFEGTRTTFDLPVDLTLAGAFQRVVLEELARVPYGTTTTYGWLAAKVGNPRAARAVGGAMNRNPIPIVLPCHRVVGSSGTLVGYGGGLDRKRALLELEGAPLAG